LLTISLTGLSKLFNHQDDPYGDLDEPHKRKNSKQSLLLVFLFPVFFAGLGLPFQFILTSTLFAFFIGLTRLSSHQDQPQNNPVPNTSHDSGGLFFLSLPIILVLLVPIKPLSTEALNTRGISLAAPRSLETPLQTAMTISPDDLTILDWIEIFNNNSLFSNVDPDKVNVIGFVYHDMRLEKGYFMLGRFMITCCVADAYAMGMTVEWPDSQSLENNAWVNVKGTISELTLNGTRIPVIHAVSVTSIPIPEQPYLFP